MTNVIIGHSIGEFDDTGAGFAVISRPDVQLYAIRLRGLFRAAFAHRVQPGGLHVSVSKSSRRLERFATEAPDRISSFDLIVA
jgi:hypothetical protein